MNADVFCPICVYPRYLRFEMGVGGSQLRSEVMMIPATMIRIAAPRTAIAISPGEYFVSFFAGPVGCGRVAFFFFLRGFFDMALPLYRAAWNQR